MTKERAKKALLRDIATIIDKDDDLFPNEILDGTKAYQAFVDARNELVLEFERRSK